MQLYDRIAAGDRIRQRRLLLGMTQEELAEKIGRAYKYCQDIERGSCGMSIETLILLSSSLNVTMDYIIYGYEDTEPKTPEQLLEMEAVEELLGHCSEKKALLCHGASPALFKGLRRKIARNEKSPHQINLLWFGPFSLKKEPWIPPELLKSFYAVLTGSLLSHLLCNLCCKVLVLLFHSLAGLEADELLNSDLCAVGLCNLSHILGYGLLAVLCLYINLV